MTCDANPFWKLYDTLATRHKCLRCRIPSPCLRPRRPRLDPCSMWGSKAALWWRNAFLQELGTTWLSPFGLRVASAGDTTLVYHLDATKTYMTITCTGHSCKSRAQQAHKSDSSKRVNVHTTQCTPNSKRSQLKSTRETHVTNSIA